jgi:DeoR/GlpR family transcriptional regulator of sugar metabolism
MKDEQLRSILDYMEMSGGFASVKTLADEMGVSEMTIRRYLAKLEGNGSVARVSSGAVRTHQLREGDQDFKAALQHYEQEKRAIASHAVSLLNKRQIIFLDTGSTCYYVARYLPEDASITVITYSLDIVSALRNRKGIRVINPGGELDSTLNVLAGPQAEQVLSSFNADIAFLGVGGIDPRLGTQENTLVQIPLKRTMARNSTHSYVLADSSKLGHRSYFTGTPLTELREVITTTAADPKQVQMVRDAGVIVTTVSLE